MPKCDRSKRIENDLSQLLKYNYRVAILKKNEEFIVTFRGPPNTPYEGGVWAVLVTLPERYPYVSPNVKFLNAIYHPNIDDTTGVVCLDVLSHSWSPLNNLANIFEAFLPQLLMDPNPSDPYNVEAASLALNNKNAYIQTCKASVRRYATEENVNKEIQKLNEGGPGCSKDIMNFNDSEATEAKRLKVNNSSTSNSLSDSESND